MGAIQLRPQYSFLPSMVVELSLLAAQLEAASTGSANGLTKALYQRHHEGTLQKRILELEYRNGVLIPKGETELTRVSASSKAIVVTGGAGINTITVDDASDLIVGGPWRYTLRDTVVGTNEFEGRHITEIDGDDVTIDGAAFDAATGDLLIDDLGEFGPLRPDGLWIASAGATPFWSGGLRVADGTGLLKVLGNGTNNELFVMDVVGDMAIDESGAGDGSFVGMGWGWGDDKTTAWGLYNDTTVWERGSVYGPVDAGTVNTRSTSVGAPGTIANATVSCRWLGESEVTGPNDGRMFGNITGGGLVSDTVHFFLPVGSGAGAGIGDTNALDSIAVRATQETAGTLAATLKSFKLQLSEYPS